LKVGDIVFLKSQVKSVPKSQVFLSSDGVLSKTVECIPKKASNGRVKGANVMTRSCLFRIENARSMQRKGPDKDLEYSIVAGKPFTYGEHIQLRHFHSQGLLEVRPKDQALQQGCVQVSIAADSSDFTWFEVLPVNKLRMQGERIKYSDAIYLRVAGLKTSFYLHLAGDERLEVNCGPEQWEWRPRRYMDYNELDSEEHFVTTSNSFRLYHRVSEGYLVAPLLPLLGGADTSRVYVERGNKTSGSLWELQLSDTFTGGKAKWKATFQLKHLATGLFLSHTGELVSDDAQMTAQSTLHFVLHPDQEDHQSAFALFGSMARFQSLHTGLFLSVADTDSSSRNAKLDVYWAEGNKKREYPFIAFCLEDVAEAHTDHIYKLGRMAPAILRFAEVINSLQAGHKSESEVQFYMSHCKEMLAVLNNVSIHILQSTGAVDLSKRQDSMREMGIVTAFLQLARTIGEGTKSLRLRKLLGARDEANERLVGCLDEVERGLLRVINISVKHNSQGCACIRPFESYLLARVHLEEAGRLLHEVFLYVQDEGADELGFTRWFHRPDRPEADLSLNEMVLCMHIIRSLCECDGKGVPHFQRMACAHLLQAQSVFPLLKFGLSTGKPFLEFVFKSQQHADYFLHIQPLMPILAPGRGPYCYLLSDLCKVTAYLKLVAAEILLLATVCVDRFQEMISAMSRELFLTPRHIETVLEDLFVPEKVRSAYARLYLTVFLDVDPFSSVTENASRCYNLEVGQMLSIRTCEAGEASFEALSKIVRQFWDFEGLISLDGQHIGHKLELTTAFLRLTQALVDQDVRLGEDKSQFVEDLMQPLGLLLMERRPAEKSELKNHWCARLMGELKQKRTDKPKASLEMKWGKLVFEVLLVFEIILRLRQDLHIFLFLAKFKEIITGQTAPVPWNEVVPVIKGELTTILQRMDFDIRYKGRAKVRPLELFRAVSPEMDTVEKGDSEKTDLELEDTGVLALDLNLLQLIFNVGKSSKKKIRKKALDIIIQNLNEKKLLKEQLSEVQFLIGEAQISSFYHLQDIRVRLCQELRAVKEGEISDQMIEAVGAIVERTVHELTVPEECRHQRAKMQDLVRLTGLHDLLISVLYFAYEPRFERLFETVFEALRLFTQSHKHNQSLLFKHRDRLLELMEVQERGVTHLLTEVLLSYRDTDFAFEVVKYLFDLLEKPDDYPYRLLQLLRTFTRDDEGGYTRSLQTDILKRIVASSKILALHTTEVKAVNYTQPQIRKGEALADTKLRFHQEVIRTLVSCTYENRFCLLQCRNLISSNLLRKALRGKDVPEASRKVYLRYFYQVHMTGLEPDVVPRLTLNDIESVLKDLLTVLKDFPPRFPFLLVLAKLGIYAQIRVKDTGGPTLFHHGSSVQDLRPDQKRMLDYWNFVTGKESLRTERDGLLHILRDMFATKSPQLELSPQLQNVRGDLEKALEELESAVRAEERSAADLDFSNLLLVLNTCREAVHQAQAESAGFGGCEEIAKLVSLLRDYIVQQGLTLEKAFALFDVDRDGTISVTELKSGLRALVSSGIKEVDLDRAMREMDTSNDGKVQFEEFCEKMKRFYDSKAAPKRDFRQMTFQFPHLKEAFSADQLSDQTNKESLREFTAEFGRVFDEVDIQPLILKIRKEFMEPALRRKDYTVFKEFISKLGVAFNKPIYKIYLIKMMRLLIQNATEDHSRTSEVQIVLCDAGVLEMALQILADVSNLELVNESIELLLAMLHGGNQLVQERLLASLRQEQDAHLFSYIRRQLRLSRDRIMRRTDKLYDRNPEQTLAEMMGEVGESSESVCELPTREETAVAKHLVNLLRLLQLCCENCYSDFQRYIRLQNEGQRGARQLNIALVNEIAQYLINLKEMGRLLRNDFEASQVVPRCLEALIDLCKGPCLENQQLLGTKKKLYQFLKACLNLDMRRVLLDLNNEQNATEVKFFASSIRLLKALLEGEYDRKVAECMLSVIDFKQLAEKAKDIYEFLVHRRLKLFMQNRFAGETVASPLMRLLLRLLQRDKSVLTVNDGEMIDLGFDICIITLKLRKEFPNEDLRWLNFRDQLPHSTARLENLFFQRRIEAFKGRSEATRHDIMMFFRVEWARFRKWWTLKVAGRHLDPPMMDLAYSFYLSLIGSVEIDKDGELVQCYFRFPTMVSYMSSRVLNSLIMDVNRNSHDEKIKSFFQKTDKYELALNHLQIMSRIRWLSALGSKRKFLENTCFLLIVGLNLALLFTITTGEDGVFMSSMATNRALEALWVFAVLLSVLAVLVYFLFVLENYPLAIYEHHHNTSSASTYDNKALSTLRGTVLMREMAEYNSGVRKAGHVSISNRVIYSLTDKESIYYFVYVGVTILALWNPFFYAVLLLDIVRRSDDLVNILRSITENYKQLLLTLLLGVIIVFLFAVSGFLWFGEYFRDSPSSKDLYCNSLLQCFLTILNFGVRAGGGVGDVLKFPLLSDSGYWYRQVYDILFFIVVSIVLLNIIFGIIIDTFGDLRDKRQFIETDLKTVCFICGRELFEFEYKGAGWNEHIQLEHNLYAYLAFIIYLRRKPREKCDGLEKFVKKKIELNDVSFFPKTARSLMVEEEDARKPALGELDLIASIKAKASN